MNLEQGKTFHEYWYLPMIHDEVYEKLGRVEKRKLFTIESDEQESRMDSSFNAIPLSRRRNNPNRSVRVDTLLILLLAAPPIIHSPSFSV